MSTSNLSGTAIKHIRVLIVASALITVSKGVDIDYDGLCPMEEPNSINGIEAKKAVDDFLTMVEETSYFVVNQLSERDLKKVGPSFVSGIISLVKGKINLEALALNMLFLNFQEMADPKMDPLLFNARGLDYMKHLELIQDVIGTTCDVEEECFLMADLLNRKIKG